LEYIDTTVELPRGPLVLRQPAEWADLRDDGGVEWAPVAPYWAVLWRGASVLARQVESLEVHGLRVLELGCGLGLPSLAAARAGAEVTATDADPEALELVAINAAANGLEVAAGVFDFRSDPAPGEFDLVIASDVLYEEGSVGPLMERLPGLAPQALIASPDRRPFERFLVEARLRWDASVTRDGVIDVVALVSRQEGS
jgi:predicted nicotinamide N-methyase